MAHGDFPYGNFPPEAVVGYPISGLSLARRKHVALSSVMMATAPVMLEGEVQDAPVICTAGEYVCVVTGHGRSVEDARSACYDRVWKVDWPSNRMFRTDIGCRLEEGLPELQKHGYARGLRYA